MSWLDKLIGTANEKIARGNVMGLAEEISSRSGSLVAPAPKGIDNRPKKSSLPGSRSSASDFPNSKFGEYVGSGRKFSLPHSLPVIIPLIRDLMATNADVGQVMWNIVSLGNTGHKIFFDRNVPPAEVDKMRNHLANKRKEWATGQAGINGLVNKMFYQCLVGGAMSTEWVPNAELTGIESCVFVKPEEIVFRPNPRRTGYLPFQRAKWLQTTDIPKVTGNFGLIPLNPQTFRYFALNGDTDLPYGIPPYITALPHIETQDNMNKNIDYVVEEWGLLGLLEVLLEKPDMDEQFDKTEIDYINRLDNLLLEAKGRLTGGLKEGVVVGFKNDVEFNWNSTVAKEYSHAVTLFKNNELQTFSGLKHDPSLAGRDYNTSETQISVVFIKMLSELRNIQFMAKTNLEFGYTLELMLAGYKFDYLNVVFNRSTLQDDLKYQQGQEIRIRNVKDKMIMGLIDQNQAADELDYENPAFPEPQVPWEILAGGSVPNTNDNAASSAAVKKKKTANAKSGRDKNKPVTKVK